MTLYRQIAILITVMFLILLITVLTISFNIIKNSAQQELYQNAQNSVSSISISLSSAEINQNSIETLINASFDNGNYEKISFINMDGEILYEREKEVGKINLPSWFQKIVKFEISPARANVSSGWSVIGILEVLNDRDVVYSQLYKIMSNIIIYLSVAAIITLALLAYIFRILLAPLKGIEKQAKAVLRNEFVIQDKLPLTKEFKAVVQSTNAMVNKFETIFRTASDTLSENKELLYNDAIMKISNRRYFILKATENLTDENGKNYGASIIISIKKTDVLNKVLGYKQTDELLYDFAQYVQSQIISFNDSCVSRINGTELAIMLPKFSMNCVQEMMENTIEYMNQKLKENKLDKNEFGISIGACEYEPQHNVSDLLSLIDYTLSQAKLLPNGEYYELHNNKLAITKERWKQIISDGFINDSFEIMYRKVIDINSKEKDHNVISFALKDDNNELYFYGTLIAPVVELGMVQNVYIHIIKKVLLSNDNQNNTPLSIQISAQFIEDNATYEELKRLFEETKHLIKKKIIFEIPESVLNTQFENSMHYINLFKKFGFGFGINSFIAYSDNYEYLKTVKPLFIKADERYILDTQQNINVLKIVLDSLDIKFIATGVNDVEKIEEFSKKGIKIVSGAVVDKL